MMLRALNIAFVLLSVIGNEFIRRRDRRGYWLWLPANLLGLLFFISSAEWWTALLYLYFSVACVLALRHWKRLEGPMGRGEIPSWDRLS
jgi:nicotinamide mononucleotide transporter